MNLYTGKTLEDLLEKAALEKGVAVEQLTYFVTDEAKGFLGFGASVSADVFADSDVIKFIKEYIDTFFTGLDLDVTTEVTMNRNNISISLNAENNAILIGKNGRSLQGINMLLRQVVNSTFKRRFFVSVDINNYKQDRYQKLRTLAKHIARTVSRTKVSASLDPMPNDERRMIHKELTDMPKIRTESEGSGSKRHIKIVYDENKE